MENNNHQDTNSNNNNNNNNNPTSILSCIQSLVKLEQSLTITLQKTKPLLSLPTPKSLSQAETILALARTYSTRTSAPPGWNPSLPVVHFATPSPYAHQLRGGALGAMQLKMVREERRMKKRKRMEEEEEARLKMEKDRQEIAKDAKKKDLLEHYKLEDGENDMVRRQQRDRLRQQHHQQQQQKQQQRKKEEVTMNLSSSSSSEESESELESDSED